MNTRTTYPEKRARKSSIHQLGACILAGALTAMAASAQVPTLDRGTLVRATPVASELLWQLPYDQVDGDALLATLAPARGGDVPARASVVEVLAGAGGVYADLSAIDPSRLGRHPLLHGALEAGVPLLLEGDSNGDRMQALVGAGFAIEDGGAAFVHRVDEQRFVLIRLGVTGVDGEAASAGTVARSAHGKVSRGAAGPGSSWRAVEKPSQVDPLALATAATALLDDPESLEHVAGRLLSRGADTQPECPASSCKQWIYLSAGLSGDNSLSVQWTAKSGEQYPFIDITFVVTLHDSVNPDFKTLTIYTTGEQGPTPAYFGTGGMFKNGDHHRGYFNEKMYIATDLMGADLGAVSLGATSPGNANNSSNVTTSNSFSVGVDSGGGSGSYTAGWSYIRSIKDFKVENKADPFGGPIGQGRAKWVYKMTSSNGGSYGGPGDLVDNWGSLDCDLFGLGSLAKNNLQAATLSTWNAAGDYSGSATFQLSAYQKVRKVKSELTWWGGCEWSAKSKWKEIWTFLTVDFGAVEQ